MIKVAFVGGSYYSIAGYPHFSAISLDAKFKLEYALFSLDKEHNKISAKEWNIKILNNLKDFKNIKDELDLVIILTPTPNHFEQIKFFLDLDLPIICEKPLVVSLDEAMIIKQKLKNNFLIVVNNYNFYPMVHKIRQIILSQELGKILFYNIKMPQESFIKPPSSIKYPQKWRLKDYYIPMISLDLGSHIFNMIKFLINSDFKKVFAKYNSFSKYNVVDDINSIVFHKNNIKGNIWYSKVASGYKNGLEIEIFFERGRIRWVQNDPDKIEIYENLKKLTILDRGDLKFNERFFNRMTPGHPSGFIESLANFYMFAYESFEKFKNNEKYTDSFIYGIEESMQNLEFLKSLSISNEKNGWVELEELENERVY